jgi:steroid delta-isomerase-like uncharacterized protein
METMEKQVVRRFYEILNSGRLDDLDEVCAPDMVGHAGAGADLDELKKSVRSFTDPFPDLRTEVRHLVQEGDLVSVWLSWLGTHRDEFAGVPATGREIKIAGWDLIRVRDGRITEITQYCDLFMLMSQIGALPTATPV